MRRSLLLPNLLLLIAIGLSCWQMSRQYEETRLRQRQFLARKTVQPPPPILALPPDPPQVQSSAYLEVAVTLPFSPDRNPTVIVEVAPPKPMPPLPAYHGMMNFGQGPRVILSAGGQTQKSYKIGDEVGPFKLVAVAESGLVFDWDGKQVPASYAELIQRGVETPGSQPAQAAAPAPAPAGAPSPAQGASVVSVTGAAGVAGSGGGVMGDAPDSLGQRECKPGDNSPDGAIVNGYKKSTIRTPFSTICRWVPVK